MNMEKSKHKSLAWQWYRMRFIALRILGVLLPILAAYIIIASDRSTKHLTGALLLFILGVGSLFAAKAYKRLLDEYQFLQMLE